MKYRLILIEDDKFALNQMSTMIKWEDYGFTLAGTFCDGADALSWLENNSTDIIITDIKMPVVTGVEIARICSEKYPETGVIFISAYKSFDFAKSGFDYGVLDYILKPLNRKQIIDVLNKCKTRIDVLKGDKKARNVINEFSHKELQIVYLDFAKGVFNDVEEFKNALTEVNERIDVTKNFFVLTLRFESYREYISEKWKYSAERLKYAISNVAYSVDNQYKFILFKQNECNIEFFGYSECLCNTEKSIEDACESLKRCLLANLNINTEYVKIDKYNDLYDLFVRFNQPKNEKLNSSNEIVRKTMLFIEENYRHNISSADAAKNISMDLSYFCRQYKKYANESFMETLNKYRIEIAKQIINEKKVDKLSVLYIEVGYKSKTYFYKMFDKYTGLTPSQYAESVE